MAVGDCEHEISRVTFRVLLLTLAVIATPTANGQQPGAPDTVAIRNGALTLRALLWRPAGRGPFPAVLFNHGSPLVRRIALADCRRARYAREGRDGLRRGRRELGRVAGAPRPTPLRWEPDVFTFLNEQLR